MSHSHNSADFPALLGGAPLVPQGLPEWPLNDPQVEETFQALFHSGAWGKYHAEHTHNLIQQLQDAYEVDHVVLTSSGTAAVELALRGLKIQEGDDVVLSAYDFKSNFTNVALLGARPFLAEIRSDDAQLDVTALAALDPDSSNIKAVIATHLHGGMVDLPSLLQWSQERGISIIEDCCQISSQAKIGDQTAGTRGDVAVLSFGGSKLITSGRGGAVLTNRSDIAQRIRLYTQRGNDAYPLSEMQAAVLLPQLDQLPQRHLQRLECHQAILQSVNAEYGLRPFPCLSGVTPEFYKLGFWYDAGLFGGMTRERFCEAMRAEGIPIDPGFSALHRTHAKRRFHSTGPLPIADQAHADLVVLHHPFMLGGVHAADQLLQALDKIHRHARILSGQ